MTPEKRKVLLDFDGNLTDETKQAAELSHIAIDLLAEILSTPSADIEALYTQIKKQILASPHLYPWEVNSLPVCYAVEGAYLLNTVILTRILKSEPRFLKTVSARFPADSLDALTHCVNHLFHEGSLAVNPHFLPQARDFLIELLESDSCEPTIFTNSETRKISANLRLLEIGATGEPHSFPHQIDILGNTRQYQLDRNWDETFFHPLDGRYRQIQVLPLDDLYQVDLRRPIYYQALKDQISQGYHDIVVVADGFSLAGALPLMMGLSFILHRTSYTPAWAIDFTASHRHGQVAANLDEIKNLLLNRDESPADVKRRD